MHDNLIVNLPCDVFNDMPGLKKINLRYNKIKFVDVRLFLALVNIKIVDFRDKTCIDGIWGEYDLVSMIQELAKKCKPPVKAP
jgi:Leucine rich repeat